MSDSTPPARPTAIDLLAATVARVTPRAAHPAIDAARHDARRILRSFTAGNTRPFRATSDPIAPSPPALEDISIVSALLPRPLAERYDAIRRDVRTMTRSLRGERTPVTTTLQKSPAFEQARDAVSEASPSSDVEPSRTMHPRTVRVLAVREETADARSFVLEDPTASPFTFVPGQFVTVLAKVDGETHRRAYSISSALTELPRFTLTVKRVANGLVSNALNDSVREGDSLEILGPSGAFTLAATGEGALPEQLWLFAGGSGITPVFSILREALAANPWTRVTLVYANRARDTVIFRDALDAVAREYPERFKLLTVLEQSDPSADVTGRLDEETCATVCEVLEVPSDAQCFVCGPEPMMDGVRAALQARGVARENIHEERFTSPQRRTQDAPVSRGGHSLTIKHNGRTRVVVTRPDQTILEAGLEAGVDMPFSCTMGGCGACKLTLSRGTVDMVEPNCLLEAERAQGAVLACVGCTTSDATVEVP
jgi:ring-1,2-phenylacetyl-CoA epoxidase subunit PaaE